MIFIGQSFTSYHRPFCPNWFKWTVPLVTWNDLVFAAKSPKECTPNHFWQFFSFLRNFSIGQSFTTPLSELVLMNCASSGRVTNVLEESFFSWNDLVLAGKSSKESTPNHFWQIIIIIIIIIIIVIITTINLFFVDVEIVTVPIN